MSTLTEGASTALQLIVCADATLWAIVGRSVSVSAAACALACGIGLALGAWLGVARFAGRHALLMLLNTLLAVPSVVIGLLVYLLLSRSGPLGAWGILFTPAAMVVAQTILVLPVVAALTQERNAARREVADLTDALAVAKGQPALIAEIANEHEANAGDLDADTQQKAQTLIDAAE